MSSGSNTASQKTSNTRETCFWAQNPKLTAVRQTLQEQSVFLPKEGRQTPEQQCDLRPKIVPWTGVHQTLQEQSQG